MRRKTYRIMAIMATALLAFATGGCVDPLDDSLKPQPEEPTLTFWIRVPGSMLSTKAETGDVASISPESKIYDVQVWAFAHGAADSDLPLNYVDKDNISFENTTQKNWDNSYKIQMPMPKEFVLGTDPRVDFYILANWQSIFNEKPSQMKLAEVRDLVFSASTETKPTPDYFGTTTPTTAVPAKGLPISTIYMGEDGDDDDTDPDGVSLQFLQDAYNGTGEPLTNEVFKRELGVIELERAVAKIRFAFARPVNMKGLQITKIEINGELIPNSTFAFPRTSGVFALPNGASYIADATTIGSDENPIFVIPADYQGTDPIISEVTDPEALESDSDKKLTTSQAKAPYEMDAQEYDDFLTAHTTGKTIYLRESGEVITGTIYYRQSGMAATAPDKQATFSMEDAPGYDETTTNLHRNHYWTVYAYFRGGSLWIKPVVLPWTDATASSYTWSGEAHVAISDKTQGLFAYGWTTANDNEWYHPGTNQNTEWFFRRQELNEEGEYDWDDWVYHSQMVIAPGLNAAGAPIYSNRIQLLSSFDAREGFTGLTLKSDNPAFGFVVYNSTIIVDVEGTPTQQTIAGMSGILDEVVIPIGDRTTYFYITPKAAYNYTVPNSGTIPALPENCKVAVSLVTNEDSPVKVPFNTSVFPGAQDNGDIYVYCVTEAEFKDYYFIATRPEGIKPYGKDSEGKINPVSID